MIDVRMDRQSVNVLGRLGENEHRRALFDISEYAQMYPNATYRLLNQLPGQTLAYPVDGTTVEGETLYWTITDADLSAEGHGRCELVVLDGEVVAKSEIYMTRVLTALDGRGDAPDPWDSYIEQLEDILDQADAAVEEAERVRDSIPQDYTALSNDVGELKVTNTQDEIAQFYREGYLLYIPQIQIPYSAGTRYIYREFWVPTAAGRTVVFGLGGITSGVNFRIVFYTASKESISAVTITGPTITTGIAPENTAYMRVMLNALTSEYAAADGTAVFDNVWITDSFGKQYDIDNNVSIDSNGLKIGYTGRKIAYFFKDKITILRTVSNQYTYVRVYDAPDFSTYTGVYYDIPNNTGTEINAPGKYLLVQVNQSSSSSVLIDYDEQIKTDAAALNPIINTANERTVRFIWFTDSHATHRNPTVTDSLDRAKADAKLIADNMMIDFVLHSGDVVAQSVYSQIGDGNTLRLASKELVDFGKIGKLIFAVGNHDGNSANSDYRQTTLYSIGYDYKNRGKQYFYFDNPGLELRFIIMANPDDNLYGPSKEQLLWLANDALNTNYNVVLVIHITPLSNMYSAGTLAGIVNSYCDKTNGTGSVWNGTAWENIAWDLRGSTAGKVAVVLGGHIHEDYIKYYGEGIQIDNTTRTNPFQCPLVTLRNTFYDTNHSDVANSEKAYAYDVCVINLDTKKMNLYRRGNGVNREVNLLL